jgi:transcriptional regulator with AAA-type ATPase domain
MTANGLYENDLERKQYAHAIQILAAEVRISEEEIYRLHEGVLREYKREAKIKIFLPILVMKRVKELLDKHTTRS